MSPIDPKLLPGAIRHADRLARIAELRATIRECEREADSNDPGGDPVRAANALPLLRAELAALTP